MSIRQGPLTLRTRLALVNATVFIGGGAMLLVLNWLSAREIIGEHGSLFTSATPVTPATGPRAHPTVRTPSPQVTRRFKTFADEVLADLLARSLLLLLAVAVLSLLASWLIARRALSRIGRVTTAARYINDGNLRARITLNGPNDEVKELADTFDAMLDRLERSFTDQRHFTAHASHELRTPLTLQRTALEIPLAQGRIPTELLPDIQRALDATNRSERLIDSLLTLARGESALSAPVPLDLADHVREGIADLLPEAKKRRIEVHTQLGNAPTAGDRALLTQLMLNLVSNAIRHNVWSGDVWVLTGATLEHAYIEVTNTGPILAPEEVPSLFTPFRRGMHRRKGSGLGLSVVRSITDTHRGRVVARPNPTGGLTVRVELPLRGAFDGRPHSV